jgi:hypothetical protein
MPHGIYIDKTSASNFYKHRRFINASPPVGQRNFSIFNINYSIVNEVNDDAVGIHYSIFNINYSIGTQ